MFATFSGLMMPTRIFEMLLSKNARVPPHGNINQECFAKGITLKIKIAFPGGTCAIRDKGCTAKHHIP